MQRRFHERWKEKEKVVWLGWYFAMLAACLCLSVSASAASAGAGPEPGDICSVAVLAFKPGISSAVQRDSVKPVAGL